MSERRALEPRGVVDARKRSYVTQPGYRQGMPAHNAGKRYPAEIYTVEEMHRLLRALGRGAAGDRNRAAVVLMWRSGLRAQEALDLYEKDLNLAAGTVTVLHGKGDKRRAVGIDPEAAAVVERWIARRRELRISSRRPLVCVISRPTLGKKMYYSCLREAVIDGAARAGLWGIDEHTGERWGKRWHLHGLRHTYADGLAREGTSVALIQYLLGHADLRTTERYLRHKLTMWEAVDVVRRRSWSDPRASHGPAFGSSVPPPGFDAQAPAPLAATA